ncbi:MAG: hypothetical protein M1822_009939, partial [Bathelium mastoideum]
VIPDIVQAPADPPLCNNNQPEKQTGGETEMEARRLVGVFIPPREDVPNLVDFEVGEYGMDLRTEYSQSSSPSS